MLNNSTTAGPPHFVDLHVNPGESVSIQLFDGNETVLRGPATVTMISQHTFPPVPMPVQVPPGHMVQQIVDENGTLRHIILSAINNNGTNSTPPATLVPQQQAYPYSCCCYCYCSSMPSPNPLPTPPPPPPPPPPIHPSNLWEMGLTHVDSTRRLPFSRTNNSKVNCNIDVTFPPSPTGTTIRRRLPNRNNYSYSKRSPLLQQVTSNTSNTSTTTTTTTTTSIGSINNNTSITTTTITTTATGTSPSSNTNHHHSNSFIVNGVTSTTTITTAKLTSSGVLSIATVTSNLTATTTTTTTVAAISTTTGSSTHNNNNNINKDNLSSTPIRGINGKSQTLTVTVSETGSVSKTGAITFPVTHLRTNGGNMATKLTASIPELITSTDQSTKQQQQHHHHSHQHQYQHPHGHQHTHQHSHQHHSHQSQSAKIEFLFTNANNNSVTSGSYNNNYNNKHNSIVSNLPSTTSNHHHHHHHHHHNIVNHGGDKLIGDSEKMKITSHHNKDNSSSGVLINRNSTITTTTSTTTTTTTTTTTPTNGLLIGSPSSPIKNVVGSLKSVTTNTTIKGSSFLKSDSKSSPPSSNHSPKNDHLSRKVRREEKTINNNKEDKESINKLKENTPQRKKSNINSNGGGNYNLDGEIGKNHSSGASSSNNSKESSPIKIPLNHSSHCKPSLQSPLPTINIPLNVTLATGPSTATLPIISIPMEASTFTKKRCDSLLTTTVNSVDPVGIKSRKESKESSGNNYDSRNPVTKSITGRNLNNRDQQQLSTSSGALPISVIVNDADSLSVESPLILIESETTSNDKSTTKPNDLKVIDSNHIEDNGDSNEKDESVDENSTIQRLTSPKKGQEAKKRKDKTDQSDGQTNQQLNGKEENNLEDNLVIKDPKPVDNKESLKVKDEIDGDKEIKDDSITVNDITAEEKCKSDDKIDSQQMITSLVSSITTTTSTKTTVFNENITANVVGAEENEKTSTHTRDNQDKDYGDKNVDENSEEEEVEDEDEDDDEEESQLTGDNNNKNNCITSNTMETNAAYGDSSDINRVKVKSSPQRSPKHLLPQIQVFCLNYTSLTATSVKLKWINEQGHHNNYHHSHHHFQSSSYGGGSILSETRHYMVEMMKLNRSNAKNGTVTPTTRIVYQGTQASCRVSHLTPSEQYSFRVRSSENNHQLVSNVLTVVTPEHQPVNKHHKRSRTQNSNQQIQFTSESSSQKQQHIIQNQEQAASRQQESLNNKIDGETRIIRSEQKCAIVIISLVSVLAVVLACIIHNLLMY